MEMQANAVYNLMLREWLNGALFPLSLSLTFILAVFLFRTWRDAGGGIQMRWVRLPGIKAACAFFWLFFAESLRAGTVWVLLRIANDGQRVTDSLDFAVNVTFIGAALLCVATFLRLNYIFSPARWGHLYWIGSALLTAGFLVLSEYLPPFSLPHK